MKNSGTEQDNKHIYMLLARYQTDIEYFLGHGNRSERNLYFDTKEEHIEETIKLWKSLEPKPEWLTHEQLMNYKEKMLNIITCTKCGTENTPNEDFYFCTNCLTHL